MNEENGPSFLLLRSKRVAKDSRGKPLPDLVKIPLKRSIKALYFLHACGWGAEFGRFARYRLIYADKTSAEQPLVVLAGAHPDLSIGSYPFYGPEGYGSNLVVRGRVAEEVEQTVDELIVALADIGARAITKLDA